jgi:hypothetical protein
MCRPAIASTWASPHRATPLRPLGDAAAFAGDQGAGDPANAVRQHALDAPGHRQPQSFDRRARSFPKTWRLGNQHRMRPAIGKTHRTDGLEEQAAAQIAGAGFGRRRRCIQPRGQAQPVAGMKVLQPTKADADAAWHRLKPA